MIQPDAYAPTGNRRARRLPLLREELEGGGLTAKVRDNRARIEALERGGFTAEPFMTEAAQAAVAAAASGGGGGGVSIGSIFTAAEQMIVSTGAGAAATLTVPTNALVGRAGASIAALPMATQTVLIRAAANIVALSMGASTILARLAAGNLKACTPAEIMTLLGAADVLLSNLTFARKTANYTATANDFGLGFSIATSKVLTLPSAPANWKTYFVFDAGGNFAGGNTLTINAGAGDTINGAAANVLNAAGSSRWLVYSAADANWSAA